MCMHTYLLKTFEYQEFLKGWIVQNFKWVNRIKTN